MKIVLVLIIVLLIFLCAFIIGLYEFTFVHRMNKRFDPFIMTDFDKEYYEDNANSVWEYEEMQEANLQYYMNLMWVKSYLESNPSVELYFYDSY